MKTKFKLILKNKKGFYKEMEFADEYALDEAIASATDGIRTLEYVKKPEETNVEAGDIISEETTVAQHVFEKYGMEEEVYEKTVIMHEIKEEL